MSTPIYKGVWINWSQNPVLGATLTLGERESGLLTAFIATFVTVVAAQLWKILSFTIHQARSRRALRDGLYHQQQVVFRNSVTPGSAAWTFLLQLWYWSGHARRSLMRTLPWAAFATIYVVVFGVLAIFSSEISKAPGSARLVHPTNCGAWDFPLDADSQTQFSALLRKQTNDTLAAETYVRTCYDADNPLACGKFPIKSIGSTEQRDVSCPWPGMCLEGDSPAYQVQSQVIDSHHDLGINAPPADRLQLELRLTCAPLIQEEFREQVESDDSRVAGMGYEGDVWAAYNYGPIVDGLGDPYTHYTFIYNTHSYIHHGYDLEAIMDGSYPNSTAGDNGDALLWQPVEPLTTTNGELSIMFLIQNNVIYREPCDDPWFAARLNYTNALTVYMPDVWVSPMACSQQYQICNPHGSSSRRCTGFVARWDLADAIASRLDLGLNQVYVAIRFINIINMGLLRGLIRTRKQNALRAQDSVVDLVQYYLPPDQWMREVSGWFDTTLALIQQLTLEYATGPAHNASVVRPEADTYEETMCWNQIVNETGDTTSFSIAGMIVLFVVGGLIIVTSFILDTVVGWVQRLFKVGEHARTSWLIEDKLQLHKLLSDELSLGEWTEGDQAIPTTTAKQAFLGLAAARTASDNIATTTAFQPVNGGGSLHDEKESSIPNAHDTYKAEAGVTVTAAPRMHEHGLPNRLRCTR